MTLKTLDNALNLLTYFTKEKQAWGVRELAKELGVSHSIVHRILITYQKYGFLVQNTENNKYELGLKFLEYSMIVHEKFQISEAIYLLMQKLTETTGESTFLTWLDNFDGVYLKIVESPKSIKFAVSVGTRSPLYVGASNKAIMAFLSDDMLEKVIAMGLKAMTPKTITDPVTLKENLMQIREQGWCYSVGEYSDEVAGLSAPIFSRQGNVIGSLTIAAPAYRLNLDRAHELIQSLKHSCLEIQNYISKVPMDTIRTQLK